jgi:hypothetical protein
MWEKGEQSLRMSDPFHSLCVRNYNYIDLFG